MAPSAACRAVNTHKQAHTQGKQVVRLSRLIPCLNEFVSTTAEAQTCNQTCLPQAVHPPISLPPLSPPHPHVEGVVVQPVLQPEQAQVGAQGQLAHTVAVEVKLVLSEVCEGGGSSRAAGRVGVMLKTAKCVGVVLQRAEQHL